MRAIAAPAPSTCVGTTSVDRHKAVGSCRVNYADVVAVARQRRAEYLKALLTAVTGWRAWCAPSRPRSGGSRVAWPEQRDSNWSGLHAPRRESGHYSAKLCDGLVRKS